MNSLILLLLSLTFVARNQECNCEQDYKYLVNYLENNFPGFNKDIATKGLLIYSKFKNRIGEKTKTITTKNECLKFLTYFVEFFDDNHTTINNYTNKKWQINESSTNELEQFYKSSEYQNTEVVKLSNKEILKKYMINDIRGIYVSLDTIYTIAIIKNKTAFRDYIGVIVDSKTKLWKIGQVKLEFRHKRENIYEGFSYNRWHKASYKTAIPFNVGFLGDYWIKKDKKKRINHSLSEDKSFSYSIKDSTVILRIPSFSSNYTNKIDSLCRIAEQVITKNPYLIIDVRGNGGGNSYNFNKLIPYIYTEPIIDKEITELYATKDIIKLYEDDFAKIMKDSIQVNAETRKAFREGIRDLKRAKLNSFVPQGEENDTICLIPMRYPKKVAILHNRGCASACEDLLFKAQQSDKTLLLGDNSGGFVGYGNIFSTYTPCFEFCIKMHNDEI